MIIITILTSIAAVAAGGTLYYKQKKFSDQEKKLKEDIEKAKKIPEGKEIEIASEKAKEIIYSAKNKSLSIVRDAENKQLEIQKNLSQREEMIDKRSREIDVRAGRVEEKENQIDKVREESENIRKDLENKLEEISSLTKEDAKKLLIEQVETELTGEKAKKVRIVEEEIKLQAEEKAKEILINAMEQTVSDYVAPATTYILDLPNDDIKGKIIGKEGRNIRAFEKATGVDLIIDDVPGSITISCFDPYRREIAILAMKKLIEDKRIHPGKIEEMVAKAKEDITREIRKYGEKIVYESGMSNLNPELVALLGRMKYRYSYGQNLGVHTMEMVRIAANIAESIGANVYLAKKCALFHDIGKVVTAEQEGSHIEIGAEIGRKYGLEDDVINAIFAHHDMAEPSSIESAITKIADIISGARPGARNNSSEVYAVRIKKLEDTVKSFPEVAEVYAIHAGREVRVIVKPSVVDDNKMVLLSHDIAKKIEKENTYPGYVQITLIRETRATAKAN